MKIIKCNNGNISLVLKEVNDVSEKVIKYNSVDASFEKHVPQYELVDDNIRVYVNHVMEDDHYIEWIMVDYGNEQIIKHFAPNTIPELTCKYQENMKAYAYCNKHGLWLNDHINK